jgi:hypothetical protein
MQDRSKHNTLRIALLFLCLFTIFGLAPNTVSGQVLYGTLTGNITDAKDASVPGRKLK